MDKKTGEILGIIIGIVGLLVALAGLAVAIPGHAGPFAVAVFGGGMGVAGGYWLYRRARALPPFSIQSVKSTFQITRPDGSQCRCSKEVKFRCNYGGQNHFPHRNIYADGEVGDFSWEGDGFLQGQPRRIAGEYCVNIAYDPSWPINKECQGTLSYSVQNTFTGNPEWVGYVCDRPGTESATMEIQLPRERACTRAWACEKSLAGEVRQLDKPEVTDQGTKIRLKSAILRPALNITCIGNGSNAQKDQAKSLRALHLSGEVCRRRPKVFEWVVKHKVAPRQTK